jgi:glycosyltransferase involved in cell wall biosynthesis
MMIKVLLDTTPLATEHALRGVGIYTRQLVKALEKLKQITVVRSGTKQAKNFKPDIIHYPYFDLFFPTLPLIKKAPTVVTLHDVIPLKFPQHYPVGIKGTANFIRQKSALKSVKVIITDSQASKHDIHQHLGIEQQKIKVVYLASDENLKKASQAEINRVKRKYKLPKNYVLYVGDIDYNKNIPGLIKAVRDLPLYHKLVCVGKNFRPQNIPQWHWIETQLALSDVADRVVFVPNVPGEAANDLAGIYSGALCYIQPSLYEGFGLPVLEAMRCKTPVVSAKNSSLIEVGSDQVVYTQTNSASLAWGINEVLNWTKTKRNERIKSAYAWSQTFSWDKTALQTLAVYKTALA